MAHSPTSLTSLDVKLRRHLQTLRCVVCADRLDLTDDNLRCVGCGQQVPIVEGVPFLIANGGQISQALGGHMEALFRFPVFYQAKIKLLGLLNTTDDLDLKSYLDQKSVIDVGCGSFIYGYDSTLPRSIVGIDLVPQSVRVITKSDPANLYAVADAKKIPFADKSYDTALLRFVIHHVPGDTAELLREVARVTQSYLIIFDHVRSDVPWQRSLQTTYWRTFDSGFHYNTMSEWDELLRPYRVVAFRRTGKMFGNVCQIILDLRQSAQ